MQPEEPRVDGEHPEPRFLVDQMLGALARCLRMLGFDAALTRDHDLEKLIMSATTDGRCLLTRRKVDTVAVESETVLVVKEEQPDSQVVEVLSALAFEPDRSRWFTRCLRCNFPLESIQLEDARERVPEYIARSHSQFRHCPSCGRIFWPGTHAFHMRKKIESWLSQSSGLSCESTIPSDEPRSNPQSPKRIRFN